MREGIRVDNGKNQGLEEIGDLESEISPKSLDEILYYFSVRVISH